MRVGIGSTVRRSIQYRRLYKTIFLIVCDFLLLFGAHAFAFVLRLERIDVLNTTEVLVPGLTSAGVGVASLWLSGVYLRVLRFQGRDLAYRIFLCGLVVAFARYAYLFLGGYGCLGRYRSFSFFYRCGFWLYFDSASR